MRLYLGEGRAFERKNQELPGCVRRSTWTVRQRGEGEEWQEVSEVRDRRERQILRGPAGHGKNCTLNLNEVGTIERL